MPLTRKLDPNRRPPRMTAERFTAWEITDEEGLLLAEVRPDDVQELWFALVAERAALQELDPDDRPGHEPELEKSPFCLIAHLLRQHEFSQKTFGPGPRLAGVMDHIRKELAEIEAAPDDITEWADLLLLAFDGALRAGHSPAEIAYALAFKQTLNEGRTWPDWRTADPNKAVEHVRAGDET